MHTLTALILQFLDAGNVRRGVVTFRVNAYASRSLETEISDLIRTQASIADGVPRANQV